MTKHGPKSGDIQKKAMLVDLTVSCWGGKCIDKHASHRIKEENQARHDSGVFIKTLVRKDALREIRSIQTDARKYHRNMTLPWSDSGVRVLPVASYDEYVRILDNFTDSLIQARANLMANYSKAINTAKLDLGQLFNLDNYPKADKIERQIDMSYRIYPIPEGGHLLYDMGKEDMKKLQANIESDVQVKIQTATQDLYHRLDLALSKVIERLSDFPEGESKIFCRSMLENIDGLLEIIPTLNITDDKDLAKLCEQIKTKLSGINPETLRDKGKDLTKERRLDLKNTRDKVKQNAEELQRMAAFGSGVQ